MAIKILLVKTSSLGDVVHNLPIVSDILQFANFQDPKDPQKIINIDWCVEKSFAEIVRLQTKIRNVLEINLRLWKKNIFKLQTWKDFFNFKKLLQAEKYDFVIDTQGLLKSAIIAKMAAGKKFCYDKKSIREPIATNFYDANFFVEKNLHAVNRNRLLVAQVFGYQNNNNFQKSLNFPDYGIKSFINEIAKNKSPKLDFLQNISSKKVVIFLTATSRDDKLWANENWVSLGNALQELGFFIILPAGSESERQRAEVISQQIQNSMVAPPLDLRNLAILLNSAIATIGVDTGLTHLSVALEIPTIAIYTATNPNLTGVFGKNFYKNVGGIQQNPNPREILNIFRQIGQ